MGGHGAPERLRSCRTVTLRRSIGIPRRGSRPQQPRRGGSIRASRAVIGRADPNLRRQRAGPTLCTPNHCEIWIRPKERQEDANHAVCRRRHGRRTGRGSAPAEPPDSGGRSRPGPDPGGSCTCPCQRSAYHPRAIRIHPGVPHRTRNRIRRCDRRTRQRHKRSDRRATRHHDRSQGHVAGVCCCRCRAGSCLFPPA